MPTEAWRDLKFEALDADIGSHEGAAAKEAVEEVAPDIQILIDLHFQHQAEVQRLMRSLYQTYGALEAKDDAWSKQLGSVGKEAAPVAPVPTFVPKGCYGLEDLRDVKVWKDAGIDADTREQYLSDEAFALVFGCSKDEFAKLPKWKRDAQKKSHKLF